MNTKTPISLQDSLNLSSPEISELFNKHINPGLGEVFAWLGYLKIEPQSANGLEVISKSGDRYLDFTSAGGALALGHNHPAIQAAEQFNLDHSLVDSIRFGVNPLQSVLAHNLSLVLGHDLDSFYFCTSGAEAVEAAIKVAELISGPERTHILRMTGSFHGKTLGTIALSETEDHSAFKVKFAEEQILTVELNNITALETLFQRRGAELTAVIIETLLGQIVEEMNSEFLARLCELCARHNVLMICDEVKTGLGRTGKMFSYEHYPFFKPDIVTMAKALGGGSSALAAMATTAEIWKRAFPNPRDSLSLSTTFSALSSSSASAINVLEVLTQRDFLAEVQDNAKYFWNQLQTLKEKHPNKIHRILGRGLMLGIEFSIPDTFHEKFQSAFENLHIAITASVVHELLSEYKIITHFIAASPKVLQILPPLTIEREHINAFIHALDEILSEGFISLTTKLLLARGSFWLHAQQ